VSARMKDIARDLGVSLMTVSKARAYYMVGLIIPDLMHSFFAEVAKGIARKFEPHKFPYVLIDRLPSGFEGHFVGVKDEEIGLMATEHLIEQGCRRIAHLRGPLSTIDQSSTLIGEPAADLLVECI
jgi:DNA-binding LacI/PurR family transcriptional regulator